MPCARRECPLTCTSAARGPRHLRGVLPHNRLCQLSTSNVARRLALLVRVPLHLLHHAEGLSDRRSQRGSPRMPSLPLKGGSEKGGPIKETLRCHRVTLHACGGSAWELGAFASWAYAAVDPRSSRGVACNTNEVIQYIYRRHRHGRVASGSPRCLTRAFRRALRKLY